MDEHADIIAKLSLANNGYTFRRNLNANEKAAAEAAVAAGLVRKIPDFTGALPKDNRTAYVLPCFLRKQAG